MSLDWKPFTGEHPPEGSLTIIRMVNDDQGGKESYFSVVSRMGRFYFDDEFEEANPQLVTHYAVYEPPPGTYIKPADYGWTESGSKARAAAKGFAPPPPPPPPPRLLREGVGLVNRELPEITPKTPVSECRLCGVLIEEPSVYCEECWESIANYG